MLRTNRADVSNMDTLKEVIIHFQVLGVRMNSRPWEHSSILSTGDLSSTLKVNVCVSVWLIMHCISLLLDSHHA